MLQQMRQVVDMARRQGWDVDWRESEEGYQWQCFLWLDNGGEYGGQWITVDGADDGVQVQHGEDEDYRWWIVEPGDGVTPEQVLVRLLVLLGP